MEILKKNKKNIDQMITAHAILHDRYKFYAGLTDVFLIGGSAILNGLVFLNFDTIKKVAWIAQIIQENSFQLSIGVVSILLFALSLISTSFDWKKKAESHNQARVQLTNLKLSATELLQKAEISTEELQNHNGYYKKIMENLPISIPDNDFNSLKSRHHKKVELSKLIDFYPKTSIYLLKVRLLIIGIYDFFIKKP